MNQAAPDVGKHIIGLDVPVLITGATGFIGLSLIDVLMKYGFENIRCFARPSSDLSALDAYVERGAGSVQIFEGNLLSQDDCDAATQGVGVIFHLATSRDGRSFPDAFMNSVVTTRNVLEGARKQQSLRRFVNISSLAVYTNTQKPQGRLLDEACEVETRPERRGDAYCFAKVKQDELVAEYATRHDLPCVTLRPGYVYGPAKSGISSRIGIGTFGVFLHMGGGNRIPLTYVDNCAEAIARAGLQPGLDNEVFNIVDDDLPTSRQFLRMYKRQVSPFVSVYVPHVISYVLCYLWERYSGWSEGQLPPSFNRLHWHVYWKRTRYSNDKLKTRVGWTPGVPMAVGLQRYFEASRQGAANA